MMQLKAYDSVEDSEMSGGCVGGGGGGTKRKSFSLTLCSQPLSLPVSTLHLSLSLLVPAICHPASFYQHSIQQALNDSKRI